MDRFSILLGRTPPPEEKTEKGPNKIVPSTKDDPKRLTTDEYHSEYVRGLGTAPPSLPVMPNGIILPGRGPIYWNGNESWTTSGTTGGQGTTLTFNVMGMDASTAISPWIGSPIKNRIFLKQIHPISIAIALVGFILAALAILRG